MRLPESLPVTTTYTEANQNNSKEYPQDFIVNKASFEGKTSTLRTVQEEELKDAKKYTFQTKEFEILTSIQHFGGKTNLIDFTTDYNVAAFFACDAPHDRDGRIVFLKSKHV